jgi:hypothetical protein
VIDTERVNKARNDVPNIYRSVFIDVAMQLGLQHIRDLHSVRIVSTAQ